MSVLSDRTESEWKEVNTNGEEWWKAQQGCAVEGRQDSGIEWNIQTREVAGR